MSLEVQPQCLRELLLDDLSTELIDEKEGAVHTTLESSIVRLKRGRPRFKGMRNDYVEKLLWEDLS